MDFMSFLTTATSARLKQRISAKPARTHKDKLNAFKNSRFELRLAHTTLVNLTFPNTHTHTRIHNLTFVRHYKIKSVLEL